jgi:hypothetical protein
MPQDRHNNQSFQTELAIKFWVVPLSCKIWDDLSMLILVLNTVALLGEEPKQEIWRSWLSHFSSTAALFHKNKHNTHPPVTDTMDVSKERKIKYVISTAVSRVFSFQSFLLDAASWSWAVLPNITLPPLRLPKQVSCNDKKVSTLVHISGVRVTIATKKGLLSYSEIHSVVTITSRLHYAVIFSPYNLFRLECDFMCSMPWETDGYSAARSELLKLPWQQIARNLAQSQRYLELYSKEPGLNPDCPDFGILSPPKSFTSSTHLSIH